MGEIDHYIRAFGVANSHTLSFDNKLYSFLEMTMDVDTKALEAFLAQHLPSYAIPSEFRILPALRATAATKLTAGRCSIYCRIPATGQADSGKRTVNPVPGLV